MSKNIFSIQSLLILALAVFSLTACDTGNADNAVLTPPTVNNQSQNNAEKTENTNAEKTVNETPDNANNNAGVCTNKYFPVSNGATWRYKVSGGNITDTYTYTVSHQNGADKFTQTQDISLGKEGKLKIEWLCFPEGLRTAEYGQLLGNPNVGMKLESKSGSGVTLPKDSEWQTGNKWTSDYDLGGNFEMGPVKGPVAGKATLNHEIMNMEDKVSTSAGEYTAAKVKTTISLKISFQNRTLPGQSITMTNWYAPNVGLVKQDVTGTMGKTGMDYLGK